MLVKGCLTPIFAAHFCCPDVCWLSHFVGQNARFFWSNTVCKFLAMFGARDQSLPAVEIGISLRRRWRCQRWQIKAVLHSSSGQNWRDFTNKNRKLLSKNGGFRQQEWFDPKHFGFNQGHTGIFSKKHWQIRRIWPVQLLQRKANQNDVYFFDDACEWNLHHVGYDML